MTDMFLPSILVVDLSMGIGHRTDKIADLFVHAELVSQSKDRHFSVTPQHRKESLLYLVEIFSQGLGLLIITDQDQICCAQLEDAISVFESSLACLVKDSQIGLKLLVLLLNLIDVTDHGSMSSDDIGISDHQPHCFLVALLPCRVD